MGLFQKAIETYDAMEFLAGIRVTGKETLAPIGYMITKASIEITVNVDGNFVRANRIEENIPIPCTEKSAGRSSAPAAHPLCDNLTYVTELDKKRHDSYLNEIKAWKESAYSSPKIEAIYKYLQKGTVLGDCIKSQVVVLDKDNKITNEKDLVTWRVEGLGENSGAVHEDVQIMKSFSKYYLSREASENGICMVSGKTENLATQHLKGVSRFSGNAKLISTNDTTNFTYLGRFLSSAEAVTIGYDSSQKAHNALKWLLSNDGVSIGDRRIVCWNPQGKKLPSLRLPLIQKMGGKIEPSNYKKQLQSALNGYRANLPDSDMVVIAAFGAATSGRLSVTYYNELLGSDFLDRLYYWDDTCCWYNNSWGVKSPALYKIVDYAFGTLRDDGKIECKNEVVAQHMQQLIACRIDKSFFPVDIMRNLTIKASNMHVYKGQSLEELLFITCAAIKKYRHDYFKEEWKMALDENVDDRSYQFGRLLAIMEKIEKDAYGKNEDRETNAIRTQAFYVQRPLSAFSQIMTTLKVGYYSRLSEGIKIYYEKIIGEIIEKISASKEELDKPLSETYLLGYYLQKNALYSKKESKEESEEE